MQSEVARTRARKRTGRRNADVYPVALATAAGFCLLTTFAILWFRPQWDTPIVDLPLGSYLMGGAGGLLTILLRPAWARRLGSRHPGRVAAFSVYRLGCAMALGGLGYAMLGGLEANAGLVAPDLFRLLVALLGGLAEALVNEVVLRGLGFLAPRGIDPRLL